MKNAFICFILFTFCLVACSKDEISPVDCGTTKVTYEADVKNIIQSSCATSGCHDATTRADGKSYSTYALLASESSKAAFLGSINHSSGFKSMPQGGAKLSDAKIKTITCWINGGKLER
jgi:hypothetical protein